MSATDGITAARTTITEVLARRSMERPRPVLISDELQDVLTEPRAAEASREQPAARLPGTEAAEDGPPQHDAPPDPRARPRVDVRA